MSKPELKTTHIYNIYVFEFRYEFLAMDPNDGFYFCVVKCAISIWKDINYWTKSYNDVFCIKYEE